MPYTHIEELRNRKSEKVAMFLTIENATGLLVCALPTYILTGGLPFWLRVLLMALAGTLGVVATIEIGGMAGYERLLWYGRGLLRVRRYGARVLPEQLAGTRPTARTAYPLSLTGPVRRSAGPSLLSSDSRRFPAGPRTATARRSATLDRLFDATVAAGLPPSEPPVQALETTSATSAPNAEPSHAYSEAA